MKFSEKWLRTWVNPDMGSEALAHELTMAGLEVEMLETVAPSFNKVVVSEVLDVVKHPDADRLNVCRVNVGGELPLTIVCGAANVVSGVKVPCALIGAELPPGHDNEKGLTIRQTRVRGIESFGMLCSEKELGLAEESSGLYLLPEDAPVGKLLHEYLELDDKLFTLKLTPNRGDCCSLAGVAREVAALTGSELKPLDIPFIPATLSEQLKIGVEDLQACPLYCGRLVRTVNADAPTPSWMLRRLERSGLRSISAVVDITNYVMLEMGQPMHAFDLATMTGGITVRRARKGESLVLLNEQKVVLEGDELVIADEAHALALAGIMGGQGSGVEKNTQDVFLESAFFHPDVVAGKARRFGLATDSSFRFERGVDFAATRLAMERATQLLLEICGGSAGEIKEVRGQVPERTAILLRGARVERVLGVALDHEQIISLLRRLGLEVSKQANEFKVIPPSYRFDLTIESDLIEELARLYGYEKIPARAPHATMNMLPDCELQNPLSRIMQTLVARDYQEIVSYAFVDEQSERENCGCEDPVQLKNPIANNMAVMRSSLITGLVGALQFNLNRKQSRVRLFEVGACFANVNGAYTQTQRLSGIAYGEVQREQWGVVARPIDFFDVKADVEALFAPNQLSFVAATHTAMHPGRSARIVCNGSEVGWIGELHPQMQQHYDMAQTGVWFEVELDALNRESVPRFSEIAKFLPVRRDLAVLVNEAVAVQTLIEAMKNASAPYVKEVAVFDVYRGKGLEKGKKSLAFQVLLQDTRKTLTDPEIESSIKMLIEVMEIHGAQLRM